MHTFCYLIFLINQKVKENTMSKMPCHTICGIGLGLLVHNRSKFIYVNSIHTFLLLAV